MSVGILSAGGICRGENKETGEEIMKDEKFEVEDLNYSAEQIAEELKKDLNRNGERKSGGEEKEVPLWREILSWVLYFAAAILVALFLKRFVIINATVPTGSMENTIMPGDDLFGLRIAYLFSEPERGDIIIFKYPDDETQTFIKRIVGVPGDLIVIEDGKIYINGSEEPLEEPYLKEEWTRNTGPYEFAVPSGCYFVMGDNRNDSLDGRYWSNPFVTEDEIIGKAEFIYFPFSRIQWLN